LEGLDSLVEITVTDISSDIEGENDRCPACGAVIEPGPSAPQAKAHCPRCGQRLWFVRENPGDVLIIKLECAGPRPAHLDEIVNQLPKVARIGDLVLDFQEVRGLYSADLARLITLKKQVDATGGRLKIRNLLPDLREVFRITRLDEVFEIDT
jgi:anti-anti-sigma factor